MRRQLCLAVIAFSFVSGLADPAAAQPWGELSEAEQAVLAPWREKWADLEAAQRQRLLKGAGRWQDMGPDERDEVRRRLQAWQAMTQAERERIRQRMERFENLDEAQQRRLRQGLERLRMLPPEAREQVRKRWRQMDQGERRAFAEGLLAGRRAANWGWTRLLEPEQRRGLQPLVEALAPDQRRTLHHHMRDLDDAGRAELARALLKADPEQRTALIEGLEVEEGE